MLTHALQAVALLLTLVGLLTLLTGYRGVRETTLVSAWWWALAALAAVGAFSIAEASFGDQTSAARQSWQFAAAVLTFCPVISLLGAKRPQHAAWNFIVLSLWGIAALPAAELLLLQRGQALGVSNARGVFLLILLLLGPINLLPTRFWKECLLVAIGQALLLSEHLPLLRVSLGIEGPLAALGLFTAAALLALLTSKRNAAVANHYDRLWLSFRDSFGLLWGLRFAERVNAAATQFGWDFQLTWQGFRQRSDGAPIPAFAPDIEPLLRQTLNSLLRRFVSPKWIADRMSARID